MRVRKEKDGRGWLFRFFSANWSEVAWARIGASGPAVEVAFPSDWSEHKMGWVRLGFGFGATDLQRGFMAVIRGIAQPTTF